MTPLLQRFDRLCLVGSLQAAEPVRRGALAELDRWRLPVDCDRVRQAHHELPETAGRFDGVQARADHLAHLHELTQAAADGARHVLVIDATVRLANDGDVVALADSVRDARWQLLALVHDAPTLPGPRAWQHAADVPGLRAYAVRTGLLPRWLAALRDAASAGAGSARAGTLAPAEAAWRHLAAGPDAPAAWRTSRSLHVAAPAPPTASASGGWGTDPSQSAAGPSPTAPA